MDLTGLKLGIVMPVWMQEPSILEMTEKAIRTIRTSVDARLYIVPSRLRPDLITAEELEAKATRWSGLPTKVLCTPVIDNSVARCWNVGCTQAFKDGCHFALIQANDVLLTEKAIDTLLTFGVTNADVDLWSAMSITGIQDPLPTGHGETADFCCFMIRPLTFAKFGTFDERFRPAYFEDNDYYGRIIIGGGKCAHVYDAYVVHLGSQTVKLDPEAAHHNNHWFGINHQRFMTKWQTKQVANNPEEVLAMYSKHPWGDPTKPISWWDRE